MTKMTDKTKKMLAEIDGLVAATMNATGTSMFTGLGELDDSEALAMVKVIKLYNLSTDYVTVWAEMMDEMLTKLNESYDNQERLERKIEDLERTVHTLDAHIRQREQEKTDGNKKKES